MSSSNELIERLTIFIKAVGWSKADLARKMNKPPSNIYRYLSGDSDIQLLTNDLYICGCSIDWLYSGNGDMFSNNEEGRRLANEYMFKMNNLIDSHSFDEETLQKLYKEEDIGKNVKDLKEIKNFIKYLNSISNTYQHRKNLDPNFNDDSLLQRFHNQYYLPNLFPTYSLMNSHNNPWNYNANKRLNSLFDYGYNSGYISPIDFLNIKNLFDQSINKLNSDEKKEKNDLPESVEELKTKDDSNVIIIEDIDALISGMKDLFLNLSKKK